MQYSYKAACIFLPATDLLTDVFSLASMESMNKIWHKMPEDQFLEYVNQTGLNPINKRIAKEILVDGKSTDYIADKYVISMQRASAIAKSVYRLSENKNPKKHLGQILLIAINNSKITPKDKTVLKKMLTCFGYLTGKC